MNCVLDLDGTILFPDRSEITIPGRTRCSYISRGTAEWLKRIAEVSNLYIASARNADSVIKFVTAIPDVSFSGFVLEGGLVTRTNIFSNPAPHPGRVNVISRIQSEYPEWELVPGYEQMICFIDDPRVDPQSLIKKLTSSTPSPFRWHAHRERHKLFLYPSRLCKIRGMQYLGVDHVDIAAGDDEIYDKSLLAEARICCSLKSSDKEILRLVKEKKGFISEGLSHLGAVEMLQWIFQQICSQKS